MIDRIEELLEPLAAEDEEEQKDTLALPEIEQAVPVPSRDDGGEAGDGGTDDRSGGQTAKKRAAAVSGGLSSKRSERGKAPEGQTAFAQPEGSGRVADRKNVTIGEIAEKDAETNRELWMDGPVWTVRGGPSEMDEARRAAAAGRTAQAEEVPRKIRGGELVWSGLQWAARGGGLDTALERAGRSGPGQTGLEGLYRQTVRGLRPAAPALPQEQAGRTDRAREPGSAASLAVNELDRAVRRDSRRYDGGLSIY